VLSRPFIILYICVFVATMGISMVSPLLPVYAKDLGANGVWLGLTFSSFAIVQAIAGPFIGRISDRFDRKPFIFAGLVVYLIAAIGYLTADSFYQVIAFRAFSGLGTSAIFSVARAYVGDMTPPGREGRWFGVFQTADIVGFGTGPLVAGVVREFVGFDAVFVCMAGMMAASAIIVLTMLPPRAQQVAKKPGEARPAEVPFRAAISDRLVASLTLFSALTSLAFGATFSFLALRLEEDIGASPALIGLAFSVQDLSGGLCQPVSGIFADRYNRRVMVAVGLLITGALMVSLGLAANLWLVVLVLAAMGAAQTISFSAGSAIQVVAGRRVGMGTMLGLFSFGNGLGIVTGSLVGGLMKDLYGTPAAFYFGAVAITAGAFVFTAMTSGLRVNEDAEAHPRRIEPKEPAPAGP
jgi:DHA1 family multidrug resistance protein-like MFS transporter